VKKLAAILVAVLACMAFMSASVYADGAKIVKGTVALAKGSDGKVASVTITSDSGMVIHVAQADIAKYEALNGKYVQVGYTTDKDGKSVATGTPTPATKDAKDGKMKTDKKTKM